MNVTAYSEDKKANVRNTKIGEHEKAFTAIIKRAELAMNLSYDSDTQDDGEGNPITFHLWVNGTWKIEYKGKEYLIPVNENIQALIDWINSQED